ncbi:MAG: hypothetical protein ACLQPD_02390 [Desulfomonilaceae bacterium]
MKREFNWALIREEGELFSEGTVIAESEPDAYRQALNQLDPNQQRAVLQDELELYVHLAD